MANQPIYNSRNEITGYSSAPNNVAGQNIGSSVAPTASQGGNGYVNKSGSYVSPTTNYVPPTQSPQSAQPANQLVSVGGQSYDISTPSGMQQYQAATAAQNPPNPNVNMSGIPGVPVSTSGSVDIPTQTKNKYQAIYSAGAPAGVNIDQGSSANTAIQQMGNSINQSSAPVVRPEITDAVGAAMQNLVRDTIAQNEFIPQSVASYQQERANQLGIPSAQADLINTQTLINGTVDDIRAEVQAAGGFATESQIQGLAATRNISLAKHLTNVQNSLQIAQGQLSMDVASFQGDQSVAMQTFNTRVANDQTILSVFKNAQTQSVDMYKNLVTNIGYQQLAQNLQSQDPSGQSLRDASAVLGIDLTNPRVVRNAETYRERTLSLSAARFQYTMGNIPNVSAGIPGAPDVTTGDVANAPQISPTDDINKIVPYTNGMNVGAVRNAAAVFLTTGKMSMGGNSKVGRAAIANEASAMATRMGLSPDDVVTLQESYKADLSSMTKLQTQADTAESFEQTALKNLNVAMSYAQKVPRTNSPWANRYDLWVKGQLNGDPNTVAFESAIYTAANEYAKVVSGGTGGSGSTDTARKEAGDVLNAFYNNEQLDSISNVMKLDMGNRIDSYTSQIQDIKGRTLGQFTGDSSNSNNSNDPAGLGI